jgi:uroporphyrinogen-III synthase
MDKGLRGRVVAVTRPVEAADALVARLEQEGARVIVTPLIRIAPLRDQRAIRRAARNAERYDWIVFTSANAVAAFFNARTGMGLPDAVSVAAVGAATAEAARTRGGRIDLVPDRHDAAALADALAALGPLEGRRVLWPRAARARRTLGRRLRSAGAEVHDVAAYRTEADSHGAQDLRARIEGGGVDVITFASPSAVRSFASVAKDVGRARVVVIGPVTARAALRAGLPVHARARVPGVDALVAAIREVVS